MGFARQFLQNYLLSKRKPITIRQCQKLLHTNSSYFLMDKEKLSAIWRDFGVIHSAVEVWAIHPFGGLGVIRRLAEKVVVNQFHTYEVFGVSDAVEVALLSEYYKEVTRSTIEIFSLYLRP